MRAKTAHLISMLMALAGCSHAGQGITRLPSARLAQASTSNPAPGLYATFWQQTSTEWRANTRYAYARARAQLDVAIADTGWSASLEQMMLRDERHHQGQALVMPQQTAVILDIDETVLDNSPLYARLAKDPDFDVQKGWQDWIKEANAKAIDGAVNFISYALDKGVAVFFVSNRSCTLDSYTRKNLANEGFPVSNSNLYLLNLNSGYGDPTGQTASCPDMEKVAKDKLGVQSPKWYTNKWNRREAIGNQYRILLLVGDSQGDFVNLTDPTKPPSDWEKRVLLDQETPEERESYYKEYSGYFEDRWVVVPNGMYGSWLESQLNYQSGQSLTQKSDLLIWEINAEKPLSWYLLSASKANRCLTATELASAADVQIEACRDDDLQRWIVTGSEVRSAADQSFCLSAMDAAEQSTLHYAKVYRCDGDAARSWFRYTPQTTGNQLKNEATGLCLVVDEATSGEPAQLSDCNLSSSQNWVQTIFLDQVYLMSRVAPDRCLAVKDGSAAVGTSVLSSDCKDATYQKWQFNEKGQVRSAVNENLCLAVKGGIAADGIEIDIETCNAAPAQRWMLNTDGQLKSGLSQLYCLTVNDGSTADNAAIVLGSCNRTRSRMWTQAKQPSN